MPICFEKTKQTKKKTVIYMLNFHVNGILEAKWFFSEFSWRRQAFNFVEKYLRPTSVNYIEFEITALLAELETVNSNEQVLRRLPEPQASLTLLKSS